MILKKILRKILKVNKKIKITDNETISQAKKNFKHSERIFFYGHKSFIADCLYCHACPGVIETCLTELFKLKNNEKLNLLNLGGGLGQTSEIISSLKFNVFNLDIGVINENEKNKKFDLNSQDQLPYKENYFDFVLCSEVIEHIENPWKLLRDITKILKKNGFIIITTPNVQSKKSKKLFYKTGNFHWFEKENLNYHINPLFIWELNLIFKKNKLKVIKTIGNGDYFFGKKNYKTTLDKNDTLIFILQK